MSDNSVHLQICHWNRNIFFQHLWNHWANFKVIQWECNAQKVRYLVLTVSKVMSRWVTKTRTSHRCFPPSFGHLAKQLQRRRYLEINQSETRMACGGHVYWRIGTKWAIFIDDLPRMLPTKFRFIWQSGFRGEDFFRNQPIRNKNCLWQPCLLTDWN
jgi:hypothetical protein